MILPDSLRACLQRVLGEQRQQASLRTHGLAPRRKLLLVGPTGSGKTMTASALAGELHLPLFTIVLDGLITKFMGETAGKLRLVFDAIQATRGVFFDEFDPIGARRGERHDVGEIQRVLNSFLQFLEQDDSQSLTIVATNHPELLDKALFRRFDDVIEYTVPDRSLIEALLRARLDRFDTRGLAWKEAVSQAERLSPAEITRAADDAAKNIILRGGNASPRRPSLRRRRNAGRPHCLSSNAQAGMADDFPRDRPHIHLRNNGIGPSAPGDRAAPRLVSRRLQSRVPAGCAREAPEPCSWTIRSHPAERSSISCASVACSSTRAHSRSGPVCARTFHRSGRGRSPRSASSAGLMYRFSRPAFISCSRPCSVRVLR